MKNTLKDMFEAYCESSELAAAAGMLVQTA